MGNGGERGQERGKGGVLLGSHRKASLFSLAQYSQEEKGKRLPNQGY